MVTIPDLTPETIAQFIDHTLLRPDAQETEIVRLVEEAVEFSFKTVCIEKKWLSRVAPLLKGTSVLPITVIGFPGGAEPTTVKLSESESALAEGARELDMVLNRDWLKGKAYEKVFQDISSIVKLAGAVPVKVILETSELSQEEKIIACALSKAAGARFVKTSTGFSKGGATEADVLLMRKIVGPELGIKASGGIRSYTTAVAMIQAGANRLGTSNSIAIVKGAMGKSTY